MEPAAVFMNYWAGLHTSPDAENIRAGAASLLQVHLLPLLLHRQMNNLGRLFV
jgi:hypothetical protein